MIIPNGGGLTPVPRRLVFAGEALVDVLMRVPALPERGGDLPPDLVEHELRGPARPA